MAVKLGPPDTKSWLSVLSVSRPFYDMAVQDHSDKATQCATRHNDLSVGGNLAAAGPSLGWNKEQVRQVR